MNRLTYFLSLSAIVSVSCNLVSGLFRGPALVETTGPILGMVVAASLDDLGQPVDASFTYPADQPEMVVLVRIGEVPPGPLTFSWFRVTEAGDESLFEQTVAVEAWGAAFSTGMNPGTLADSTYKVVATFGGDSETIVWDIEEPQPGAMNSPVGTSQSPEGGSPTPGPSGTAPVEVPDPGLYGGSGPTLFPKIYLDPPLVGFGITSHGIESPVTIQLTVAVSGSPSPGANREYVQAPRPAIQHMEYDLDPCSLPGGSDLPGTSMTLTAVALGYEANPRTVTQILGEDTSRPIVHVDPPMEPRQKVHPGDQIVLEVVAEELESEGSWQTGIFTISLTGPDGLVKQWEDPGGFEQACDSKSWTHQERFTYTVPPNPPATIELCVLADDYAENVSRENCRTYYTGDLIGTLTTTLNTSLLGGENIGTDVAQGQADLSLTLQSDGTLKGTGVYTYSQHGEGTHSCGSYSESSGPIRLTLPVSGTWTHEEIVFRFTTDTAITVESVTTCAGDSRIAEHDVTNMFVGREWRANWDGQAYTADGNSSLSGATWTSEETWTIKLEP